jgi:hypothetical protein
VAGKENPDDHVPAIVEVPGDAPHCFEVRCTCGYWSHTDSGIAVAEEVAIRHFYMATGIAIQRKEVRQ